MEVSSKGVEDLPERPAETIGRSGFSELGPILLHGAGKLKLLSIERWPRHSDRKIEEILKLGSVGRCVRKTNRRKEILRRVLVVELIGRDWDEGRHREVGGQRGTGEGGVGAGGGEGDVRRRETGERILRGNDRSCGAYQGGEGGFVRSLVVGDGSNGEIEIERGEEAPFIVIGALDDRDAVELAGGERGA